MNMTSHNNFISLVRDIYLASESDLQKNIENDLILTFILACPSKDKSERLAKAVNASPSKRFRMGEVTAREAYLKAIFDHSFAANPERLISAAEQLSGQKEPFYPAIKRVTHISLPKRIGSIFGNKKMKNVITLASLALIFFGGYKSFKCLEKFLKTSALPYLKTHLPLKILEIGQSLPDSRMLMITHLMPTLFYTWIVKRVVLLMPKMPYVTRAAEKIDLCKIFEVAITSLINSPISFPTFLTRTAMSLTKFLWEGTYQVEYYFSDIARHGQQDMLKCSKAKTYAIYKRAVQNHPPLLLVQFKKDLDSVVNMGNSMSKLEFLKFLLQEDEKEENKELDTITNLSCRDTP